MSVLPVEIAKELVCSFCDKYLSVLPVKVYPDKTVRCNRCSSEDDVGTVSVLYEMVMKKMKFPCINRLEGCQEMLQVNNTNQHESEECLSLQLDCCLCSKTLDSIYYLPFHITEEHKEALLEGPAFWIDLNRWNREKILFYYKDDLFMKIQYIYRPHIQELGLSFMVFGKNNAQRGLTHLYELYCVGNSIPLDADTTTFKAAKDGWAESNVAINLTNRQTNKDIIFCFFKVQDPNNYPQILNTPIIDGADQRAVMKFKFDNICNTGSLKLSDFTYWVGKRLWQLAIEDVKEGSARHLAVFLCQKAKKHTEPNLCKIHAEVSLMPHSDQAIQVKQSMTKGRFKMMAGWTNFLNWNTLVDPQKGFVVEDSIEFEVLMEVSEANDEEDQCLDCPNCH